MAPYLGLMATAHLQSDWTTAVFANGGHNPLGSFADGDNTLASVGANLVKHWGALRAGISLEHTRYFDDAFGQTTNIGNDVNVFASYLWKPNRVCRSGRRPTWRCARAKTFPSSGTTTARGSTSSSGCQGRGGSWHRQGFAVPITWAATAAAATRV